LEDVRSPYIIKSILKYLCRVLLVLLLLVMITSTRILM